MLKKQKSLLNYNRQIGEQEGIRIENFLTAKLVLTHGYRSSPCVNLIYKAGLLT